MPGDMEKAALKSGKRVKIVHFPRPTDPWNSVDYNGLIGEIKASHRVGNGLGNQPVYAYTVYFKDITLRTIERAPDGRLIRGTKQTDAQNYFEESYIEEV